MRVGGEAVLVHDPVGLGALGRAAPVEDERLLDADALAGGAALDGLVSAGGLPVAGSCGAVRPDPVWVLAVARAEEVPLLVPVRCPGCSNTCTSIKAKSLLVFTHGSSARDLWI